MRKFVSKTICELIVFFIPVIILLLTPCSKYVVVNGASSWTKNTNNTFLGTSQIIGCQGVVSNNSFSGNYVYWGKYNEEPIVYCVLSPSTSKYGSQTMFLDCNSVLYNTSFGKNNNWASSNVRSGLNGDAFLLKAGVFTAAERNAIAPSYISSHTLQTGYESGAGSWPYNHCGDYVALTGEKVFLLDSEDISMYSDYNYGGDSSDTTTRYKYNIKTGNVSQWWLRSACKKNMTKYAVYASNACAARIGSTPEGPGNNWCFLGYSYSSNSLGVSPALNIRHSSILFSSLVSGTIGKTGAEYKLTILDDAMIISIPNNQNVTYSGRVINIPYEVSGANKNNVTQISLLITDKKYNDAGAEILYYETIVSSEDYNSDGTVSYSIPSNLIGKLGEDYHVYIFAEDINEIKETDYASNLLEITSPIQDNVIDLISPQTPIFTSASVLFPYLFENDLVSAEQINNTYKIDLDRDGHYDMVWNFSDFSFSQLANETNLSGTYSIEGSLIFDYTLTFIFPQKYDVVLGDNSHGSVTFSPGNHVLENETVSFNIFPDNGYKVVGASYEFDGKKINIPITTSYNGSGSGNFVMPNGNVSLLIQYEGKEYSLSTVTYQSYGTISVASSTATVGSTVEISVTPNEGYKLSRLYYKMFLENEYRYVPIDMEICSFEMPASDVSVYAEFDEAYYTCTVKCNYLDEEIEGSFTMGKSIRISSFVPTDSFDNSMYFDVSNNGEYRINVPMETGLLVDKILYSVGGESPIDMKNLRQFVMPSNNVTVTICLKKSTYNVCYQGIEYDDNGQMTGTNIFLDNQPCEFGEIITPLDFSDSWVSYSYYIDGWYIDKSFTVPYDFNEPNNNITCLYARLTRKHYYQVLFYADEYTSWYETYLEDSFVTKPTNPTKSGYKFSGWYTDASYINPYNFSSVINDDLVLYAKWDVEAPICSTTPVPTSGPSQSNSIISTNTASFEDFVERLYMVALNRASEPEGKAYWCEHVGNGDLTGASCAREFLTSEEFKNRGLSDEEFLTVLYKTFFDRDAANDPEGFNFWLNSLKTQGRDTVVEGFINSTEWCNICASYGVRSGATYAKATIASKNATAFAERLYTKCLRRDAEPDGLKWWSLALTNLEVSGSTAARGFFESTEFQGFNTSNEEYLTRLYRTFMGREPDDDGMNYWLNSMSNGMTREQVFDNFVYSQEFTEICKTYGIDR